MNKRLVAALLAAAALLTMFGACAVQQQREPNTIIEIKGDPVTPVPVPETQPPVTLPPLETEAPTPTPGPNATDIPLNTPQPAPNYSIFDNCAFVGNSIFEGLYQYGVIKHGKFFTRVGLNVLTAYTQTTTNGSIPVMDELNRGHYAAVILMFGQNELGWPNMNTFIAKYEALIKDVMRRQPGAKVFVMGLPPCTKAKSASSTNGVTNQNISIYNSQILDMCSRLSNCYYVAVPESLMTADGALPADASGDGIHLNLTYSRLWADHICLTVMSVMSGH